MSLSQYIFSKIVAVTQIMSAKFWFTPPPNGYPFATALSAATPLIGEMGKLVMNRERMGLGAGGWGLGAGAWGRALRKIAKFMHYGAFGKYHIFN